MSGRARRPTSEGDILDGRLLAIIEQWHRGDVVAESDVDALALDIFRFQLEHNAAYRTYGEYLEVDLRRVRDPRAIPAVPASAFKESELTTFPHANAALHFRTSGTTAARRGSHYLEHARLLRRVVACNFRPACARTARIARRRIASSAFLEPRSRSGVAAGFIARLHGCPPHASARRRTRQSITRRRRG